MIFFSPDALMDVERLRTFLNQANPGAARRGDDDDLDGDRALAGVSRIGDGDERCRNSAACYPVRRLGLYRPLFDNG